MKKTLKIISIGLISLIFLRLITYIFFQIKWNLDSSNNNLDLSDDDFYYNVPDNCEIIY